MSAVAPPLGSSCPTLPGGDGARHVPLFAAPAPPGRRAVAGDSYRDSDCTSAARRLASRRLRFTIPHEQRWLTMRPHQHAFCLLFSLTVAACGDRTNLLQCEQSVSCDLAAGGMCSDPGTGNGWCAYPDASCPSGYRYSNVQVGDGVSGQCVPPPSLDAGVDAPVDTNVVDGDTSCRVRIAFVDGEPPVFSPAKAGRREIWISNPDGSGMLNISNNDAADDTEPTWAPNGLRVAFASNRGGAFDIVAVNVDGTGLVNLTSGADLPFDAVSPLWSPDGTRIAFVHGGRLWVMNANGTGAAQVSTRTVSNLYGWSSSNTQLVFSSASPNVPALYVATVGDGSPTVKVNAGSAFEARARWSSLNRIIFDNGANVFAVDPDGTDLVAITQDAAQVNTLGAVTDDGNTIVFQSQRDDGHTTLWAMPVLGGTAVQITRNTLTSGGDFARDISADGQLVVFTRTTNTVVGSVLNTTNELGVVGIDGTGNRMFNAPSQSHATQATFSSCL